MTTKDGVNKIAAAESRGLPESVARTAIDEFAFVDTAIGGVRHRNHVMPRADVRRMVADLPNPTDCFVTYCAFTRDFLDHAESNPSPTTGRPPSVAKYPGPALATFVPIDLDCESDLSQALSDARAVITHLHRRWHIASTPVWFSGAKGFSIHIPATLFGGFEPSVDVAKRLGRLVEALLTGCDVGTVDPTIYENLRLWRIPNTRHGGSGLFKIRLSVEELMALDADRIRALAVSPRR